MTVGYNDMDRKRFLVSSHKCYKGYCREENDWRYGTYQSLIDNRSIDNSTITCSQTFLENEIEYFKNYLKEEIAIFEKRYHTIVLEVAICDTNGLWNSSPIGGKIIDIDSPLNINGDNIEVSLDKYGFICVTGSYHNRAYEMCYYFLTESSLKRTGLFSKYEHYGASEFTRYDFEKIYNRLNPVKLSKYNTHYQYVYNKKR